MTALEIRVRFAMAKINLAIYDTDEAMESLGDVVQEAEALGMHDYRAENNAPSVLISAEPELEKFWHYGWHFLATLDEMIVCKNCNNGTGNPCRTHG